MAAKAMLAAATALDEDLVHQITAAIFRNIPDLIAAHPRAADLSPERAFRLEDGMAIELHAGAERYWQERQ